MSMLSPQKVKAVQVIYSTVHCTAEGLRARSVVARVARVYFYLARVVQKYDLDLRDRASREYYISCSLSAIPEVRRGPRRNKMANVAMSVVDM